MWAACRSMRTVGQTFKPVSLVAFQPDMNGLPGDGPITHDLGHSVTVGDYCKDRFVLLLRHAHLPHARECQVSAGTPVRHQPKH